MVLPGEKPVGFLIGVIKYMAVEGTLLTVSQSLSTHSSLCMWTRMTEDNFRRGSGI